MPDLLTHVLVAFVVLKPATWWLEGVDDRHLALVMIGTVIPDLSKLRLVVPAGAIGAWLGRPVLLAAIHRLGPVAALAGIGATCFERGRRIAAFGWLAGGGVLHLLLDLAVIRAGGVAPPYLYPLTWWEPPAANLLLSSDRWPWLLAATLALAVWAIDRAVAPGDSTSPRPR